MKHFYQKSRRLGFGIMALGLAVAVAAPSLLTGTALAAQQVSSRSVQISSSKPSAAGVSYKVSFTPTTTAAKSLVIDFCGDTPIIGASCAAWGGDASGAGFTAGTGTGNWVLGTSADAPTTSTVKINMGTGSQLGTSAIDFTLTNITNPSTTGSFYARIYTYGDTTYGSTGTVYSSPTAIGSDLDYGGFALSTALDINVTATIMETLTFCVTGKVGGVAPTSCTGATTPTVTLGHGTPQVLSDSQVDDNTADPVYTVLSTNAQHGVSVLMKTDNTCTGLSKDNGATCDIAGQTALSAITAGSAKFGMHVANGTGGTGTVTANATYGPGAGYNMGSGVTSAYGDPIESSTGTLDSVVSTLTFAATAGATTPAGIYSANENLIATGTF